MRGTCFWYHDPLTLCIMQMSLEFSDAELRRLRDHDALLTHVGITTLSDVDCQASMDRMLLKFATLSAQEIPKLKSVHSLGGAKPAAGCSRGAAEAARFEGGSIHQCCHRHSEEQR